MRSLLRSEASGTATKKTWLALSMLLALRRNLGPPKLGVFQQNRVDSGVFPVSDATSALEWLAALNLSVF